MKNVDTYQGKKILILGMARSGYAVAKLLLKLGAELVLNDASDLSKNVKAHELEKMGVKIFSGSHPVEILDSSFSYMVKNPGISYDNVMVQRATELQIPIITEPEVAAEVSEAPIVAITGSNGKTTTTMLTAAIVDQTLANGHAFTVGNIGRPISEIVSDVTNDDVLILEISSFQLLGTTKFHPHVAAIIDIYETHLDYHKTFENYVDAKLKVTQNQGENDYLIANFDQPEILELERRRTKAAIKTVSLKNSMADYYLGADALFGNGVELISTTDIALPGKHNLQNALVAIAIGKLFGATSEQIKKVLTTFTGVRHRLQFVKEFSERKIYNDSKSTNIEAATVAIESFSSPEVLIAGGLDRGFTFEALIKPLKQHVHGVVFYGQTKDLLEQAARSAGINEIEVVDTLKEAVPLAMKMSRAGDTVLFSPACASWDQFKTFEERGERFIEYINDYTEKNS